MVSRETVMQVTKCGQEDFPVMLSERFPHILEKLINLWGKSAIMPLFSDLLQPDGRGGGRLDRDGFPDEAWNEILQLKVLHDQAHPELIEEDEDEE